MKIASRVLVFLVACACACAFADSTRNTGMPKFSDYFVNIYSGQIKIPTYYKKSGGEWRDDMGKVVAPPEINFAGKYFIGLHSCGAGCRYYTLSDLEKGSDSKALDTFSSDGDRPQKTSDGRTYVTSLIGRSRSKMLVAQYHIEKSETAKDECRERMFFLSDDGNWVRPITKTINSCQEFR